MLFKDLRLKSPPRFSLTHCLFFVAVLYRLSHRAIQVDIVIWENLEWALLSATDRFSASLEGGINLATLVPVLAMVCHFFIFSLVLPFLPPSTFLPLFLILLDCLLHHVALGQSCLPFNRDQAQHDGDPSL